MRRKKLWVVTLMAFMVLALPALAQKKEKKPKKGKIPVTVTFRDFHGADWGAVPVPPDRIMGDCQTGDCPYKAVIGSATGNFRMGVGSGPKGRRPPVIRELFLDFSDCVSPFDCNLPDLFMPGIDDFAFVGADGAVNFHTSGIDLRDMFLTESAGNLEFLVSFDLNSIDQGIWRLDFRPNDIEDCEGSSSSISVTRTADDTWEISAGPDDVACLLQPGESNTFKFSGRYHMPFKMTLECEDPTQCVAPSP